MNFTREPIIETIITPKDGYKLILKNTKSAQGEEFSVDAVEVISFGNSIFYRSLERPKAFLLPVSDYEVVEQKETRISLKNATIEKSVKIPSGMEKQQASTDEAAPVAEKKKEKKKTKRKKIQEKEPAEVKKAEVISPESSKKSQEKIAEAPAKEEKKEPATSVLSRLFPPPSSLISDKISSIKSDKIEESSKEGNIVSEEQQLQESRQQLVSSLEKEGKKLDDIWAIDSESDKTPSTTEEDVQSASSNHAIDNNEEKTPEVSSIEESFSSEKNEKQDRKKQKKDDEKVEEALEEVEATRSNTIVDEISESGKKETKPSPE